MISEPINIIKDKEVISSLHGGKFVFETLITNGDIVDEWIRDIKNTFGEWKNWVFDLFGDRINERSVKH